MSMVWVYLLFILGLVLIIKGGDFFVDASTWIAEISGIPKFIIGATIVSLATTLPELLVSCIAAAQNPPNVGIAVGNAVGSVTANTGLIMGISLICIPSIIKRKQLAFKGSLLILCCLALFAFSFSGKLGLIPSIIILILFGVYIFENVKEAKNNNEKDTDNYEKPSAKTVWINILKFIFGAAGIVFGADLLVDNGQKIAQSLGVSDAIIGVTVIAIGTSLPELVTTITAIAKKQASLSVGNIIGANIIDLTLIMPLCAVISGGSLPIDMQSARLDLPICLLIQSIAIIPALISQKFKRWQGVTLILVYVCYIALVCSGVLKNILY